MGLFQQQRFDGFPQLARGHRQGKTRCKDKRAVPDGQDNGQLTQVNLPSEVPQHIVAQGQQQRPDQARIIVGFQGVSDSANVGPNGKAEVDSHPEPDANQDPAGQFVHVVVWAPNRIQQSPRNIEGSVWGHGLRCYPTVNAVICRLGCCYLPRRPPRLFRFACARCDPGCACVGGCFRGDLDQLIVVDELQSRLQG